MSERLPECWTTCLNAATSADEIVRLSREYLSTWSETERARLPGNCIPPPMRSMNDVSDYAYTLAQEQLAFDGPYVGRMLLDRMASFFTFASSRLANLAFLSRARI